MCTASELLGRAHYMSVLIFVSRNTWFMNVLSIVPRIHVDEIDYGKI